MLEKVYAIQTSVGDPLNNQFRTLGSIFGLLINILLGVGWSLVFVMLALGFIQYIMSKGEPKATDAARNWLTYSALGGVGLFFITAIRFIVTGLLEANSAGPSAYNNLTPF